MAPEMLKEEQLTPRLDVYQMGLVIMYLLTGAPPIKREGVERTMNNILAGKISYPIKYQDHPIDKILRRVTALNLLEHFADMREYRYASSKKNMSKIQ